MKVLRYLGNIEKDYRNWMQSKQDLWIDGVLVPIEKVIIAEQTHSDIVHKCTAKDAGAGFTQPQIPVADALITNLPELYLLVRTADCTPVLFYDESQKVVSAIHSGREGTRKNIVGKAISIAITEYQCQAANIKAYIGAGISMPYYEVSEAIWHDFIAAQSLLGIQVSEPPYRHLDIQATILAQLLHAGLLPDNISCSNICTYESDQYFSFRRDGTTNRQINLIGVSYA